MILVDTSVWVDFFNGAPSLHRQVLHKLIEEDQDLAITGIVVAETLQGLREDPRVSRVRAALLACVPLEPRYPDTYLHAAEAFRSCRRKGMTVRSIVDCLIAAIAVENESPLLAKDRDFESLEKVMGLKLVAVA